METYVIAKVVLCNQEDILVLERTNNDPHRPGEFDLPGGCLEPGESPEEVTSRETLEETGQAIALDALRWAYASTITYPERSCMIVRLFFTAPTQSRLVTLTEHNSSSWVHRRNILTGASNEPRLSVPHLVAVDHIDRHGLWPLAA